MNIYINQKQTAFIISNYSTESYLSEIKKRGLQKRKVAAENKLKNSKASDQGSFKDFDYRLLALEDEELKCAAALRLDLSNISKYVSLVDFFIEKKSFPDSFNINEDIMAKYLLKALKKLNESNLAMIKKQKELAGGEAVHNLTQSLMYEYAITSSGLEMDILIILPTTHQIIGTAFYFNSSCPSFMVLTLQFYKVVAKIFF